MKRSSPRSAFTLVEMLVVMAVIAILTGIILNLNGLVQNTGARHRASAEIRAMSGACEAYKADNGGYPQDATLTDSLDPVTNLNPSSGSGYQGASLFLWQQLSGHLAVTETDPTKAPSGTNYASDIFKDTMFSGTKTNNRITKVIFLQDPFGNSYGYSTAGLAAEQAYKADLISKGTATRPAVQKGYNPSFDLWSTAGASTVQSATGADVHGKWVKNW